MDPIEILGGLLGGGSSSGGSLSGGILKDLLGGESSRRQRQSPPSKSGSARTGTSRNRPSRTPQDIGDQARELEDLLGVARDRHQQRQNRTPAQPPKSSPPTSGFQFDDRAPVGRRQSYEPNEEALVLIRAMIHAAKSDGRITVDEQNEIMGRLSHPSDQAIQFLRQEFARTVSARDFAWSVPLGMEQKVYTLSLAAIQLDRTAEADYLRELAHGLRMAPEICNEIHEQFGQPLIY